MAKILIVEDDKGARKIYALVCKGLRHTTLQASDGARAWSVLQDNPDIDLVVTDYQMPSMNGRDLVEKMQGDSSLCQIPVLMISGTISIDEIRDLLGMGVSRFLVKGEGVTLLKKYIYDLLDDTRGLLAHG